MRILEVKDKPAKQLFLDVVDQIYSDDLNYVRPFDGMIEEVFSEEENSFFKHGVATRFILINSRDKVVGRIAAFVNYKKASGYQQPTGGIGFFECINDEQAAFSLFDVAKGWLVKQGMQAMDGPINFGENDMFWGLLVEGFTKPGFGMQYNPPYYKVFFEKYGFKPYFEQITNHLDLTKPFPERFWKIARWVVQKPDFEFKHFTWKDADRFLDDFVTIYNDAWQFHENFTPIDKATLRKVMEKSKSFMMEDLIWYAYHNGDPIGFIVMFPDINQVIKDFNGKLTLLNKLKFFWRIYRKAISRTRVVVLGVRPRFQRSGIESGLFWQLRDVVERNPQIKEMELSWVGDFNPKMRALQESLGAVFGKKHITYRFLFDASIDLGVKATTIPVDTKYKKEIN